ncbi:acyl-CoA thioester hydrolase [Mesonia hippocampi]|uniref:Acyl-CoA thioester hydrolase n=1 Tax=Mesonia hippocampi TaxID=1628250 RepID=A0A840EJ45_9FLAO|nr:acyl-CoA thioesterase [Mesonia hippocampi]MBB4118399.1 acyl-CoA thioester hydrolase [Mesonia hippocampi]
MYLKEFDIRWSDVDANRHLANSAYINFMSHTRMAFLVENGFGQKELIKNNLGPVVFYEHVYYFKEIFPDQKIRVSLELKGLSEDGKFFQFEHNFYDDKGVNYARCEMMGTWIDLKTRKITKLQPHMYANLNKLSKTSDFKVLTKEDTRRYGQKPENCPEIAL